MQRRGFAGACFLSLILGVALLPACGGGAGDFCNSVENQQPGKEVECALEEIEEETPGDPTPIPTP